MIPAKRRARSARRTAAPTATKTRVLLLAAANGAVVMELPEGETLRSKLDLLSRVANPQTTYSSHPERSEGSAPVLAHAEHIPHRFPRAVAIAALARRRLRIKRQAGDNGEAGCFQPASLKFLLAFGYGVGFGVGVRVAPHGGSLLMTKLSCPQAPPALKPPLL